MKTQRRGVKPWTKVMIAIMLVTLASTMFLMPVTQAYSYIYGEEPWLQPAAEEPAITKDQQVMYFGVIKEVTAAGYVVEAINMELAYGDEVYDYDQDADLVDVVVRDHTDVVTLDGSRTLNVQTPVVVAGYQQPEGRVEALVLGDMQAAKMIEPESATELIIDPSKTTGELTTEQPGTTGEPATGPLESAKSAGKVGILSADPVTDKRYTTIDGDFSKSFTWKKNVPAFSIGSLLTVSLYLEVFSGVEMNWNFPFEVKTRLLDPIRFISLEELYDRPGETWDDKYARLHALKALLRVNLEPLKQQKNRTLFAEAGVRLSLGFEGSIMGSDFNEKIDLLKLASSAVGGSGLHMQVGGKHAAPLAGKQTTFGIREEIGFTEDAVKCTMSCTVDLFTEDSVGIKLPFFEAGIFTMGFMIQPLMLVYGDFPKIRQIEATPGLKVEAIYHYDQKVNHDMASPVSGDTPIYPYDALLLHVQDDGSGPPPPDTVYDLSFQVDYNPRAMVGFLYQATMSAKKLGVGAEVRLPMMALPVPFDFDLNAISGTGMAELSCTTKELKLAGCTNAAFQFPASSIIQPIALATSELPGAISGIPYESGEIEAYGGVGELALKTVGMLPGGLKLVKTDGKYRLKGTTSVKEGRYTVKLQVSDREGKKREFELPLEIGKIYPERIVAELIPGQLWSERLKLVEADGSIADDVTWRLDGDLPASFYELADNGTLRTVPAELEPGEYSFRAVAIRDGEEFDTGTEHRFTVMRPDVAAERGWTLTENEDGGMGNQNLTAAWHNGLGRIVSSNEAGVQYPYYASMAYAYPESSADQGWMYVFGGASAQHYRDPAFAGHVYRWDESGVRQLYRDSLDGSGPSLYDAATAALPDGQLLVFGGDYQGKAEYGGVAYDPKLSNETWLFDPDSKRFTKIVSAESPGRRSGSQIMTYVPELGKVVLFGENLNGKAFLDEVREQEIWLFDPDTLQWSRAGGGNKLALGLDEGTQLVYSRTEKKLYILVSSTKGYGPASETAQTRLYSIDVSSGELGSLIDESAALPEASAGWGRGGGRLVYDENQGRLMFFQDKGLHGVEQWSYALAQADSDRESMIVNGEEEASFQFYAARFLDHPEEWRIRWQQLGAVNILDGESSVVTKPDEHGNVSITVSYEDYDQLKPYISTLLLVAENVSDGREAPIGFARIELLPVPPDMSNSSIKLSPSAHDYLFDSSIKDGEREKTSQLTITLQDDAGRPLPGRKLTLQDSLKLENEGLRFYLDDVPPDGIYDEERFLLDLGGYVDPVYTYVDAVYTDENGQVDMTLLNNKAYWITEGDHPFVFELADGTGFTMQEALSIVQRQLEPSQTEYRYQTWSGDWFEMQVALDGVEWEAYGCADGNSLNCFEMVSGELPDGLVFNWRNGKISGMPKSPGTYTAGIRIPYSASPEADVNVTITVLEPLALDDSYRVWWFGDRIGEPFSYSLDEQVRGGVGPFSYEVVEGSLPPGIHLEESTGIVSGTFTHERHDSVKVRITETGISTDSSPGSLEKTLNFNIDAPDNYGAQFTVFDKVSVSSRANIWVSGLDGIPAGSPEGAFEPYGKNQYYELIRFGSTAVTEFQLNYENHEENYKDELELYYWHPGEGIWKPFAVQYGSRSVTADVAGAEELEEAWQRSEDRFMNFYVYDRLYIAVGKKEIPQPVITYVGTWNGEPERDEAGNEQVQIEGYHFTDDAVVYVGGREALSFYMDFYNDYEEENYGESSLSAWLPAGTGTKDVVVITRGGASNPWPYEYQWETKTPAYDLQLRMKVQSKADLDALEGGNPYPEMLEHSHLVTVELVDGDGERTRLDDVLLKGSLACNVLDEAEQDQCFDPEFTLTNWTLSGISYETLYLSCTHPGSGYFLGCAEIDSDDGRIILKGTLSEDGTFQAMLTRFIDTCESSCWSEVGPPQEDEPGAEIDLVIANEDGYYGRLTGQAPLPERREYSEGAEDAADLLRITTESLPALDLDISPNVYDVPLSASGGRGSEHYEWYWGGESDIPPGLVLERDTGRLRLAGLPDDPETPSAKPGTYLVTIMVSDGFVSVSRTFTLKVVGSPERDVLLTALAVHGGDPGAPYPLSDAFAADRTSYGLQVPYNAGTLYVAPTIGDYQVNGMTVTDAVYQVYTEVRVNGSMAPQLEDGSYAVTPGDGWTHVSVSAIVKQGDELLAARAYTILVDRSASAELDRVQFQVSGSPEVTELQVLGHEGGPLALSVPDNAERIVVRPFAVDASARLSVTVGESVYYLTNEAMTSPIALPAQSSTPFEFKLSAPDSSGIPQERSYTVLVNRERSDDASLQHLALIPELLADRFAGQLTLQGSVAYEQEQVELIARTAHAGATVQVASNGHTVVPGARGAYAVPLDVGSNTVQVVVTAENGTSARTYMVEVERQASRNASLSALEAEPLTLAFLPEQTNYEADVAYDVERLRLKPATADSGADVQVLAGELEIVAGADEVYTVPLQPGANMVKLIVTAADGTNQKQYRLTVRRDFLAQADANDEAKLDSLTLRKAENLSTIRLDSDFDPGRVAYSATSDGAVVLNAVPSYGGAEILVTLDDQPVTSDEPGMYKLDPAVGDHVVSVYILSESKENSFHYRIQLKRLEDPVVEPVDELEPEEDTGNEIDDETEGATGLSGTFGELFRIALNGSFPSGQSKIRVEQLEASDVPPVKSGQWRITEGYRVTDLPDLPKQPFAAKVDMLLDEEAAKLPDGYEPRLFVYNVDTREWIDLGGEMHEGRIVAPTDRLGIFAVFVVPTKDAALQDGFSDMAGHWAAPWIRFGAALGLTNGYPDGTYKPQRQVSRLEFVSMLLRLVGHKIPDDAGDDGFTDEASIPKWGLRYAAAAQQVGIVTGYPDGTFRPQTTLTRAEMMAMLARALDLPEADTALLDEFSDKEQVPDWVAEAIAALLDAEIVDGRGNGNLAPGEPTTRAEVMKILVEAYTDSLRRSIE